jgi:hypothetical protein
MTLILYKYIFMNKIKGDNYEDYILEELNSNLKYNLWNWKYIPR